jgi:hypothetical protein
MTLFLRSMTILAILFLFGGCEKATPPERKILRETFGEFEGEKVILCLSCVP